LRSIGMSTEEILASFHDFDDFRIEADGVRFTLVPERLRGEVARFDITAPDGTVIVEREKRITARHSRELEKAGVTTMVVPDEFLLGRIVATNLVDKETGEVVAKANDEITEEVLEKLREGGISELQTLYVNDLDRGAYISQTLRIDDTTDQWAARVAIYRMMRPGEPPTEDAVETLFNGLFFSEERYDLSSVGRMKFNRRAYPEAIDDRAPGWVKRFYERIGKQEEVGPGVLSNQDILAVIGILLELRNG